MKVSCYADFIKALLEAGFSFSSGNPDGIFTIVPVSWSDHLADSPLHWFSGDPENDPWEWRQRVLLERDDIAYGKFFIRKGSYITREWMPLFLSVRRGDSSLEEAYQEGTISNLAKRIYEIIANEGALPVHELKHIGSFSQVKKTAFEGALAELQTRLFITICGQKQKRSRSGEEYGWSSSVYCTTEQFWGDEIIQEGAILDSAEAEDTIYRQILRINPVAEVKQMQKFVLGR